MKKRTATSATIRLRALGVVFGGHVSAQAAFSLDPKCWG